MNPTTESLIVNVSPNPFISNFKVSVLSAQEEDSSLNIYNVYGQAIQRNAFSLRTGINEIDMNGEELPSGLYYLHYRTLVSRIFIIIRLVKN